MAFKVIATNKKAYRNYHLTDKWECGVVLIGAEVKSIRAGYVNFKDSYARVENGQVYLYSLHVNPYKEASYMNEEPDRKCDEHHDNQRLCDIEGIHLDATQQADAHRRPGPGSAILESQNERRPLQNETSGQ